MVTLKQLLWLSLHSKLCDFYRDAILSPMFPETRRIYSGVRSWMLYVIFVDEEGGYVLFIIILAAFYILFLYLLNRFTHFVPNTIYKWPIYTEISLAGLVFPCGIFSMFLNVLY